MSLSRALRRLLPTVALVLAAASPLAGAAGDWQVNGPSRVRLISDVAVAPRDGELRLGLHFRLEPGWHVYWKNSGDAGYPPRVDFTPKPGLAGAKLLWPAPQRFELPGGLLAFGYEHEMIYPVAARLASAQGDRLVFEADLDYLVCEVDCIPFRSLLTLTQPLGEAREDPGTAPLVAAWWAKVPNPVSEVSGVTAKTGARLFPSPGGAAAPVLEVRIEGVSTTAGTDLFLEPLDLFEAGRPVASRFPEGIAFQVPLSPKTKGAALPASADFAWTATGLERQGQPLALEARAALPLAATPEPAKLPASTGPQASSLPAALGLALLAGLLSLLNPGGLALLVAEGLALRQALERGAGNVPPRALATAAGTLTATWGLATAAIALGGSSSEAPWGAHLENAGFTAFLAVVATALALNLWGSLAAPFAPAGEGADRLWRHALAGALLPLAAAAWPLPLLAGPLGLAGARGPGALLAVATAAGLGLALPWLAMAGLPRAVALLPAAGPRARSLREGLGFAAGATTLWLLYHLGRRLPPEPLAGVELSLLGIALLAWVRHRAAGRVKISRVLALALGACALAAIWLADTSH